MTPETELFELAFGNPYGMFGPAPPPPTITIESDGSVDPYTRGIVKWGRSYNFSADIANYTILILCSDIVVDGKGFTLQENGIYPGVKLSGCSKVTVKNLVLRQAGDAIVLTNSSSNTIVGNTIAGTSDAHFAISLDKNSTGNSISKNAIFGSRGIEIRSRSNSISENRLENGGGILIYGGDSLPLLGAYNQIFGNTITGCWYGLDVMIGCNNSFYANTVSKCTFGVCAANIQKEWEYRSFGSEVANNRFYHNNFINNSQQVRSDYSLSSSYDGVDILYNDNFWDNGTEGNYWSNYNGTDANGDGIGDTPYTIFSNRTDRYPLICPFDIKNNTKVLPSPALKVVPVEQQPKPFPWSLIATVSVAVAAVVAVSAVVYLKKRSR